MDATKLPCTINQWQMEKPDDMIPIVSVGEMRQIDDAAINSDPCVGYEYMDRAGKAVADRVSQLLSDPCIDSIAILCGKGNNGGDGFIAGRYLLQKGFKVVCFSLFPAQSLSNLSSKAQKEFMIASGATIVCESISDLGDISGFSCIIDAIVGTGFVGALEGRIADIIEFVNSSGVPVIAIDTPSGISADTGAVVGAAINAMETVTLGLPKIGMFYYPARTHTGTLTIADLAYPLEVVTSIAGGMYFPNPGYLRSLLPKRKESGSKFDHGHVLIVAGSKKFTGCAALCSLAALKSGCGVATLALPQSCIRLVVPKLAPEVIACGLTETRTGSASAKALAELFLLQEKKQAVCLGPGLTQSDETLAVIREFVQKTHVPLVLDADGLNAFIGKAELLRRYDSDIVITPHRGEWERLFGKLPRDPLGLIARIRMHAACRAITIVLKGSPTIVALPSGRGFVLPVGNSGMATAGSGDVLAGIITSLIAQGAKSSDAAVLGVYLHGMAGENAAEKLSPYCLMASDIISFLPEAFLSLIRYK